MGYPPPRLFVLGCISLLLVLVNCDSAPSPNSQSRDASVNPYTSVVEPYSHAASSALKYARSHPAATPREARRRLAEGYQRWVENHESTVRHTFRNFRELHRVQQSIREYAARSPHVKSARSLTLDSLLSSTDLSSSQRSRVKTRLSLAEQSDSLSQLKLKLDRFDAETTQQLEEEDRKIVL